MPISSMRSARSRRFLHSLDDHLIGKRISDFFQGHAAQNSFFHRFDDLPSSMSDSTSIPSRVPQSFSLITTSCATSTNRRVRYPALAVSMRYPRALSGPVGGDEVLQNRQPFRKFAVMGVSMIPQKVWPSNPASRLIVAPVGHCLELQSRP